MKDTIDLSREMKTPKTNCLTEKSEGLQTHSHTLCAPYTGRPVPSVGIHGRKSALILALGRSIEENIKPHLAKSIGQGCDDGEFSLSQLPTPQAHRLRSATVCAKRRRTAPRCTVTAKDSARMAMFSCTAPKGT